MQVDVTTSEPQNFEFEVQTIKVSAPLVRIARLSFSGKPLISM